MSAPGIPPALAMLDSTRRPRWARVLRYLLVNPDASREAHVQTVLDVTSEELDFLVDAGWAHMVTDEDASAPGVRPLREYGITERGRQMIRLFDWSHDDERRLSNAVKGRRR